MNPDTVRHNCDLIKTLHKVREADMKNEMWHGSIHIDYQNFTHSEQYMEYVRGRLNGGGITNYEPPDA